MAKKRAGGKKAGGSVSGSKPASKSGARSRSGPGAGKKGSKKSKATGPALTARTADRHALYQAAVQNVEAEIDFVDSTFRKLRGRHAVTLREDFCGTGNTSCEWARRRATNVAIGLDIDEPTLRWGREHCVGGLEEEQAGRVRLLNRDVREPGDAVGVDCVLAMNFSYWLFMTREEMLAYFRAVRESLAEGGVFFQDFYGGYEAMKETTERRRCNLKGRGRFTYVWDQHRFEPISGRMDCRIHFEFPDGSTMKDAFLYSWRLWTLPELREVLADAGFRKTTVYWEGDDGKGGGNGVFKPAKKGDADPAFICYVVSEK